MFRQNEIINNQVANNKISIFFEDVGIKVDINQSYNEILEIDNSKINIEKYLNCIEKSKVIVIGNQKDKSEIFQCGFNTNKIIEFYPVGKLRNRAVDLEQFNNCNVIFNKCFSGMTLTTNNTYLNIKKISERCEKLICVDTIGEGYLRKDYFPTMISLLNITTTITDENITRLLSENVIILKGDELIRSGFENYWAKDRILNYVLDFDSLNTEMPIPTTTFNHQNTIPQVNEYINTILNKTIGKERQEKTLLLILVFFFGVLGVHRFYKGKILSGILMFLTFGGFGIWWLADLCLIATDNFK